MKERVTDFMTLAPDTINKSLTIAHAMRHMREAGIRHLPVLDGGKVVGIISDRDIKWGLSFGMPESLLIEEVMTTEPYCVSARADLEDVVSNMIENKYGASIVLDDSQKVVGIFTTIDALKALAQMLKRERSIAVKAEKSNIKNTEATLENS